MKFARLAVPRRAYACCASMRTIPSPPPPSSRKKTEEKRSNLRPCPTYLRSVNYENDSMAFGVSARPASSTRVHTGPGEACDSLSGLCGHLHDQDGQQRHLCLSL